MKLLALTALLSLVAPISVAHAQSTYDDLDDTETKKRTKEKTNKRQAVQESEVVREVERGFYAKAPIGSSIYLGTYAAPAPSGNPIIRPGTYLALAVGQDFVDQERTSIAWELAFAQGVHNGEVYDELVAIMSPEQLIQGDLRTLNFIGNLEFSIYPARRLGIGLRAGGGVMLTPYLVNTEFFQAKKNNPPPTIHQSPHPMVFGGPTIEYYTKLSHFSLGLDVDVGYQIDFDLLATVAGYFKYSF